LLGEDGERRDRSVPSENGWEKANGLKKGSNKDEGPTTKKGKITLATSKTFSFKREGSARPSGCGGLQGRLRGRHEKEKRRKVCGKKK